MSGPFIKTTQWYRTFTFLLLTFALSTVSYSQTSPVKTYEELLSAIRSTRHASETRIEQAVDREKVREAWETGKLIDEHILLHKERQEYGEQVVLRLAKDLEIDRSEITRMVEFARTYPIGVPGHQLSWAHYKALLAINEDAERENLAVRAEKENWNRDQVWAEVNKRKSSSSLREPEDRSNLSESKPGKVSVYKVIEKNGKKYYDLGFSAYRRLLGNEPAKFKAGKHVFIKSAGPSYQPVAVRPNPADLYTYKAKAGEVVDGDTFHADIDLGFGILVSKRLRFLNIDAPEIESSEGKKAKAHLEKLLANGKNQVLIKTFGEDQHGRPLVQAWVNGKSLEQEMLNEQLAVKIEV